MCIRDRSNEAFNADMKTALDATVAALNERAEAARRKQLARIIQDEINRRVEQADAKDVYKRQGLFSQSQIVFNVKSEIENDLALGEQAFTLRCLLVIRIIIIYLIAAKEMCISDRPRMAVAPNSSGDVKSNVSHQFLRVFCWVSSNPAERITFSNPT